MSSLGLVSFCFCCHNVFKGLNRRPFCNFNRDLETQPGTVFFFSSLPSFVPPPLQPTLSINHQNRKYVEGSDELMLVGLAAPPRPFVSRARLGLSRRARNPEKRCEAPLNVQKGTRTCDKTRSSGLFYTPPFEKIDFSCQARLTLRYPCASKSPAIDVSLNRSTTVRTVTHAADGTRVKPSSSTARGHGTLRQHWPSCFLKAPRPPSCSQCLQGGMGWGWGTHMHNELLCLARAHMPWSLSHPGVVGG